MSETAAPLEDALAAHLTALEEGREGDLAALLAAHPDHAEDIAEFLELRRHLGELLGSGGPAGPPGTGPRYPVPFGEYDLLAELGSGGMGIVFRARHRRAGRVEALKLLRGGRFAQHAERRRFETEAAACLRLDHPGIVPVFATGECEGQPYFTMRLLTGGTLAARAAEFRADPVRLARLVADLAAAVDYAHRRGILHRDVKPSNVLFDGEGRASLCDFGLAKVLAAEGDTQTGAVIGSAGYMAPEQTLGGDGVTTAADVYGLGGLIHFCATGAAPNFGDRLAPVRSLPRDLDAVRRKCLAAAPGGRYAGADELADDLRRFLAGRPVAARRSGRVEAVVRFVRREPRLCLVALVALAGVATAAYFAWDAHRKSLDLNRSLERLLVEERDRQRDLKAANYRLTLGTACYLYEQGKVLQAGDLVATLRPAPGEPDFRGFLCRYLDRQTRHARTLTLHADTIVGIAYHPDGRQFATVGRDRRLVTRDAATGEPIREWVVPPLPSWPVLSYSPDGSALLLAHPGGGGPHERPWVKVFRDGGAAGEELHPPWRQLLAAEWTSRGDRLYLAGEREARSAVAVEWSPLTGQQRDRTRELPDPILHLRRVPGRPELVAAVRHAATGRIDVVCFQEDAPEAARRSGLDFPLQIDWVDPSPDGGRVAAFTQNCGVFVIDLRTMKVAWHSGYFAERLDARGCWADGGRSIAVIVQGTQRAERFLVDSATGKRRPEGTEELPFCSLIERDPTGNDVLISAAGKVHRRGSPSAPCRELRGHVGEVWGVAFRPGGRFLASGADDATVRVWDVPTGREVAVLRGHASLVMSVAFSPDGSRLYSSGWDRTVRVWDPDSGKALHSWPAHDAQVARVVASPDGTRLYSQGRDGRVRVWNARDFSLVRELTCKHARVMALSPDGTRLAGSTGDEEVTVWDTGDWRVVGTARLTERWLLSGDFTHDGRGLILGKHRGRLTIRDAASGTIRHSQVSSAGDVVRVLGALGEVFAASEAVKTPGPGRGCVVLHDRELGRPLLALPHPHQAFGLAFSPDGGVLATGCHDGVIRLWDGLPVEARRDF